MVPMEGTHMNITHNIACAFCGCSETEKLYYYELKRNRSAVRCIDCARLCVGTLALSEWSYRYSPDGVRTVNPFATWTVEGRPGGSD